MEELIYEIRSLEGYMPRYTRFIHNYKDTNKFKQAFIRHKLNKILSLADGLLISSKGGCDWDNISILQTKGYSVGPGEKDSFGWLTGVIHTSKGAIVYG